MRTFCAIVLLASALAAQAQERIALVIGNGDYKVGPLRNPVNDARAMAKVLRETGFEVMHGENLSHREMFEAVRDFGRKLAPGVVALFYYAGHGLQVRDRNFLIPIEADVQSEEEVPYTSVDVNFLLDVMNRAKSRVNIVILDACRNNPFARSFRSGSSGLAQMEAPSGTLIAYATAPGRVASDGAGDHGLYTEHLLRHLATPGLAVEIVFKRVRESVERATKSRQIPWESSSLKGDFSFVPSTPVAAATPAPPPATSESAAFELAFWDSIKASSQLADYQAYLTQYPNGRFAALARARIRTLSPARAKLAAAAPTPIAAEPAPRGAPAVGELFIYEYTDLWKPGTKLRIAHTIAAVSGREVIERVAAAGQRAASEVAWPAAAEFAQWELDGIALREFSPYALALGVLKPGEPIAGLKGPPVESVDAPEWSVRASISEEDVTVPAGKFRAVKVVLRGTRPPPSTIAMVRPHSFTMTVWYARESTRAVKMSFESFARMSTVASSPHHREVYELVSASTR